MVFLSRGNAAEGGGDDDGIPEKAAHSTAIVWADLIRNVVAWCHSPSSDNEESVCGAPMLVSTAFSPILAQAGSAYLQHLGNSYLFPPSADTDNDNDNDNDRNQHRPNVLQMAQAASSLRNSPLLSKRERFHMLALHYLLHDDHPRALATLHDLLVHCPGDAFGLSLAIDVATALGDRTGALRAATSVASYWNERDRHTLTGQAAMPGHAVGSSLIAVGYAIGGRYGEAERIVERTKRTDTLGSPGLAAWTLAHVYDVEGRVSY